MQGALRQILLLFGAFMHILDSRGLRAPLGRLSDVRQYQLRAENCHTLESRPVPCRYHAGEGPLFGPSSRRMQVLLRSVAELIDSFQVDSQVPLTASPASSARRVGASFDSLESEEKTMVTDTSLRVDAEPAAAASGQPTGMQAVPVFAQLRLVRANLGD